MSYIPLDKMTLGDGAFNDAFGRLRVCEPVNLAGLSQEYNSHPLAMDNYATGSATAAHSTSTNSTILTTVTGASSRALRQTKLYLRYIPGKSHLVKQTGTLRKGSAPTGQQYAAIGYFDDDNGAFFKDSATGVSLTIRSNVSGTVVDTDIPQSDWSGDKMDGTGPSGITVDWTKEQIFMLDLQWLGVGRIRFYLFINGAANLIHEAMHANRYNTVYMRTACLPVRWEVNNNGTSGNISAEAVCFSVDSEGGVQDDSFYAVAYSAYIASPASVDTTMRPLVTRRIRDTFNGVTCRGHAHLQNFELLVGTNSIYWEIRYNPTITIGTGGSTTTTNVDSTNSISEYDTYTGAANTISGGLVIACGFASPGTGSNKQNVSFAGGNARPLLARSYANVRDQYTLCARSLSGSATVSVTVNLKEQY